MSSHKDNLRGSTMWAHPHDMQDAGSRIQFNTIVMIHMNMVRGILLLFMKF